MAARMGLRVTLLGGLALQVASLCHARAGRPCMAARHLGRLRHGRAVALGHRQGPDEDERQEHHQGARAGRPAVVALPVGRAAHRLEERPQGRGVLPRRTAARRSSATAHGLWVDGRGRCSLVLAGVRGLAPARARQVEGEGEVQGTALEDARGERPLGRALLPLRGARRLVRRRRSGVPLGEPRVGLHRGRELPGALGDRLRRRPVGRPRRSSGGGRAGRRLRGRPRRCSRSSCAA